MAFRIILLLLVSMGVAGQDYSFVYDGVERTYRVHVPQNYDPQVAHPLILNLHGLGSNGFQQQIYTGFDRVADTAGIVMAYPNGINNVWNVTSSTGTDDVGFLSALIDTLVSQYAIDTSKVYSTGMSMGGFMSHRLACELSDRIAAIASVTGLLAYFPCQPSRPVPVLQMHGTEDNVVLYAGVENTIQHWVGANSCFAVPEITELPDTDTTDQCTVTLSHYTDCDSDSEVMLYTVNGGEHTWPGATLLIGVTNYDIDGSSEIWRFFSRHSLDPSSSVGEIAKVTGTVSVYPNPVGEDRNLTIEHDPDMDIRAIRLTELSGKTLNNYPVRSDGLITLHCANIEPGMYILHLSAADRVASVKIVFR